MQIICNHCGNQLSFPDYQNLVICDNCGTCLQLKETEVNYTVSIIDEYHFDELLGQNIIVNIENKAETYFKELLEVEKKYTEISEKTAFFSLLSFRKIEPILIRTLHRLIFCGIVVFWNYGSNAVIMLCYVIFIGIIGLLELYKWMELYSFEREYKIESEIIMNDINDLMSSKKFSDDLEKWYTEWIYFQSDFDDLKSKYHY
jgi:transcription elongation factor Elf1